MIFFKQGVPLRGQTGRTEGAILATARPKTLARIVTEPYSKPLPHPAKISRCP